jgi:hypothetical protein
MDRDPASGLDVPPLCAPLVAYICQWAAGSSPGRLPSLDHQINLNDPIGALRMPNTVRKHRGVHPFKSKTTKQLRIRLWHRALSPPANKRPACYHTPF